MRSIANYDVTAACGYVGCPLNGFKNSLAPLKLFIYCSNLLKTFQVILKALLGLAIPNHGTMEGIVRLVSGQCKPP